MIDTPDADASGNLDVTFFVSDAAQQAALFAALTDGEEDTGRASDLRVVDAEKAKAFGSFDLPFYVGLVLSVPVNIGSGLVGSWIWERIQRARAGSETPPVKVQFSSRTVMVTTDKDGAVSAIAEAVDFVISQT